MQPDFIALLTALSPLGGPGMAIAFVIWWSVRQDKLNRHERADRAADRKFEAERRFNYDKERLETDKALAGTIAALTNELQHRQH